MEQHLLASTGCSPDFSFGKARGVACLLSGTLRIWNLWQVCRGGLLSILFIFVSFPPQTGGKGAQIFVFWGWGNFWVLDKSFLA